MKRILLGLLLLAAPAAAQPTASFSMRTTGYAISESAGPAPLGVVFNALATTSGSSANAFHDLLYVWDFGDPGSGSWTYAVGNFSKNRAFGPIAGHLYKTPGTYTVRLTVKDSLGNSSTDTDTVTVASPDTTFSMANSYCYANAANTFVGCVLDTALDGDGTPGNGICTGTNNSHCVVTSSMANVNSNIAAGRRHSLRRGDSFGSNTFNAYAGTGFLEAFGSGARPKLTVPGVGISITNAATSSGSDWTIQSLEINPSTASAGAAIFAGTGSDGTNDITIYDVYGTGGTGPLISLVNAIHEDVFVQENSYEETVATFDANGWAILTMCRDCAFLGNSINVEVTVADGTPDMEGPARFHHFERAVASNNRIRGGAPAKTVTTIRSCDDLTPAGDCTDGVTFSRYGVISDNLLLAGEVVGGTLISLQEEHSSVAMIFDMILERNYGGCDDDVQCNQGGKFAGRDGANADGTRITIRNNIFNLTKYPTTANCLLANTTSGADNTTGDWSIYNNTVYTPDTGTNCQFAFMPNGTQTLRNNLMYAPLKSARTISTGGATFVSSNNLRDVTDYTGDPFVAATGARDTPQEFQLNGTVSAPVNGGYAFTGGNPWVYLDAFNGCRPFNTAWDVGAHEFGANTLCLPSLGGSAISGATVGGGRLQ